MTPSSGAGKRVGANVRAPAQMLYPRMGPRRHIAKPRSNGSRTGNQVDFLAAHPPAAGPPHGFDYP